MFKISIYSCLILSITLCTIMQILPQEMSIPMYSLIPSSPYAESAKELNAEESVMLLKKSEVTLLKQSEVALLKQSEPVYVSKVILPWYVNKKALQWHLAKHAAFLATVTIISACMIPDFLNPGYYIVVFYTACSAANPLLQAALWKLGEPYAC